MTKQNQFNPVNERIKYNYRIFLHNAQSKDFKTCKTILKNIRLYEEYTNFEDFKLLNTNTIHNYIDYFVNRKMSKGYLNHNIKYLREFFFWLSQQKGFKNKINYNTTQYFNLTNNQKKEARAEEYKESYLFDEIFDTISKMPNQKIIDLRNKAIISLQALCGLRISELRTVKLKNLKFNKDTQSYFIYVTPKDMEVKFAKTRCAYFMPINKELENNVISWKKLLIEKGFKDKDPLFPAAEIKWNNNNEAQENIKGLEIKSNSTIINIFKTAFNNAGYDYLRPHSFRHTIARWAEKQTPQFFNAVRISLGHSSINTTFQSYATLTDTEVGNILKNEK